MTSSSAANSAAGQARELPLPGHQAPAGVDDATVEALGKLSEALETCEQARGHLYAFHQLTGAADGKLADAIDLLDGAGHRRPRTAAVRGAAGPQRAAGTVDLPGGGGV